MTEKLDTVAQVLAFIQEHQALGSILLSLVFAWIMTWYVKHKIGYEGTPGRRWLIRLGLATPFGAIPVLLTFPREYGWGWIVTWACVVGFGSWPAFDIFTVLRDKVAPWWRARRDANRAERVERDP